jgi:hypothetical protein
MAMISTKEPAEGTGLKGNLRLVKATSHATMKSWTGQEMDDADPSRQAFVVTAPRSNEMRQARRGLGTRAVEAKQGACFFLALGGGTVNLHRLAISRGQRAQCKLCGHSRCEREKDETNTRHACEGAAQLANVGFSCDRYIDPIG